MVHDGELNDALLLIVSNPIYTGEIQDITWNSQGDILYVVENIPQGDKNKMVLWVYHPTDSHVVA